MQLNVILINFTSGLILYFWAFLTILTYPHLTSLHLTSPHLTSPHLTSPKSTFLFFVFQFFNFKISTKDCTLKFGSTTYQTDLDAISGPQYCNQNKSMKNQL
jgi:hypothetical protein